MPQKKIDVCIGDSAQLVGTLWFEMTGGRQFSRFQYDDGWLSNPIAFAISPHMPLTVEPSFFRADGDRGSPLPPPLTDSSPDSWGRNIIRKDAAATKGETARLDELDYLLSVDDFSRMGALRYRLKNGDGSFLSGTPDGRHEVPPLIKLHELGQSIASLEKSEPMTAKAIRRLRQVGSSLGGARPKCSIIDADGVLSIAKFTSRHDTANVEAMEVTTLQLASLCGINAPTARIDRSDDLPVAIIPRFDRGRGRKPYVSAQTFLGAADAISGDYVQLVEAIRVHSSDVKSDIRELFKRITYTILISNVDDHLRNHGFLHTGRGLWRLSPLFDVNPAPERHRELKTPISSISGSSASIGVLLDHASFFDLTKEDATKIIGLMAQRMTKSWMQLAKKNGMSAADISHYRPAFEHEDMEMALKLTKGGQAASYAP